MDFEAFCLHLSHLKLTGKLNRNTPEANRQAIREYLAGNDYWTFGANDRSDNPADYDEIAAIMAASLGLSVEQFASNDTPYIDPELTARGLLELRNRLQRAAAAGERVLFATNHPGSLLGLYVALGERFAAEGGHLLRMNAPVVAPDNRWLDEVSGVVMLSDEGNLMHSHVGNGFYALAKQLSPDLVVADHGFAMDAINAELPTVAIFDVDDPALAIDARRYPERVWGIPMNDNQTNIRTAALVEALWSVEGDAIHA